MVRVAATMFLTALLGSLALAQSSTPKWQVFAGYSLLHADKGGLTDLKVDSGLHDPSSEFAVRTNFEGFNAEAQYNTGRWFGIAVDASGYSATPFTATSATGLPTLRRYAFLIGPVLTYRTKSKVTPYVHALFGAESARLSASTPSNPSAAPSIATNYSDFTIALGGGVDYQLSRHFSIRGGQLDWYHTSLPLSSFYDHAYNSSEFEGLSVRQKNLRFSAGVVARF